jgi:hypothetical protein
MWQVVRGCATTGVTIILTTHYIEEAEEMADRVGVISKGEIMLVEEKAELMRKLGKKELTLQLQEPLAAIPERLRYSPELSDDGSELVYTYDTQGERTGITTLLKALATPASASATSDQQSSLEDIFVGSREERRNEPSRHRAIYTFEMARTWRTLLQSIVSPVISTSLYFVVFGGAIGSRIQEIDGVSYGAFIVPGLIMLSLLTQSISNASFGIYFPKFTGTIYELLSAPVSFIEIVVGYVGAAATKSIMLGLIILVTAPSSCRCASSIPLGWCSSWCSPRDLQPVRLHHRHLGRRLREAAGHPAADRHAAHLPRRQLLLDRHAAAILADGERCSTRSSI